MDTTTQHMIPPLIVRSPASRRLAWTGTVIATAVLAAALVWLVAPHAGPYAAGRSPLEQLLGSPSATAAFVAAGVQAVAGVVTAAIGVSVLAGWLKAVGTASVLALLMVGAVALGLLGFDGIVIAGYSLAFLVPLGIVAVIVVLAVRRPLVAAALAIPVVGVVVLSHLGIFPLVEFSTRFAAAIADDPVRFGTSLGLIAFVGVWTLWAATPLARRFGRVGAFAERHRVVITVAAAACAAPYVVARASWLTPWPLFGGSTDMFSEHPEVRVVGLMLGGAMLVGAVLTLGLVLPWGTRLPRWVPRVGGKPVPVPLAVVPASVVAVLFTAGGVQSLVLAASASLPLEIVFVLPFWLWGPMLALATWGYARHRARRVRSISVAAGAMKE
ncbi:hypothetical protein [Agromyces sp. Soil535]|uniref:hypothetical protein n=1 Tax=Agromyces sp. Soil535 TaxID=1736390 RepID=UPI0006F8785F|nr:hypothetical protein [Agromyces sp. Soil535]KRE30515.1 hypothetical protein ASG80_17385 [Agromyces sp. Soil535]